MGQDGPPCAVESLGMPRVCGEYRAGGDWRVMLRFGTHGFYGGLGGRAVVQATCGLYTFVVIDSVAARNIRKWGEGGGLLAAGRILFFYSSCLINAVALYAFFPVLCWMVAVVVAASSGCMLFKGVLLIDGICMYSVLVSRSSQVHVQLCFLHAKAI